MPFWSFAAGGRLAIQQEQHLHMQWFRLTFDTMHNELAGIDVLQNSG
jgi:hypothetical protein